MSSTNAGYFFQTTASIAQQASKKAKVQNKLGNPITLGSKILALASPANKRAKIYTAQANGTVTSVDLTTQLGSQPILSAKAPMTCLAIGPSNEIYAGCWDGNIYSTTTTQILTTQTATKVSQEFVKTLLLLTCDKIQILLSGSADGNITIFTLENGTPTQRGKTNLNKGSLQALAVDPLSPTVEPIIFAATSSPTISMLKLKLSQMGGGYTLSSCGEFTPHETSIYAVFFTDEGDVWTASADKTAKLLLREEGWRADLSLPHPDFVRDIVVASAAGVVVTGCRDEHVRIWDQGSGALLGVYKGHYEEITSLFVTERGDEVVSGSIDGTVRTWSLDRGKVAVTMKEDIPPSAVAVGGVETTAEEDAELAALLEDD
ncbi:WD40 repeat-like protein [Piedraia hortae CBS 480.64]|uniref:WD40 repeat-like protein n=1 Tax=Piedraia hortae CBS 480.64 TaxID=1314780 RepID=A0A6A7BVW9_9PEZI|nr:WD40 repeat-like protein [Piedraia hortae CBS 480.64]